jgi:cytochrome c oxidase cbb3-type subunit III
MSDQIDYDGIRYQEEKHAPNVFRILFTVLVVWGLAFSGYYLFSGWSSPKEYDEKLQKKADLSQKASTSAPAAAVATKDLGKQLYAANCSACHGETGKGTAGVGPDLTVTKYKYGKARQDVIKSITEGRAGGMPGFSGQLDKGQIETLANFVLTLK